MAAIDKIYGTLARYDEFHDWVAENNPELLQYFYTRDGREDYDWVARPITNLSELADMWLLGHCPIGWVTDRIKEQYNLEHLINDEVFVYPHLVKYYCPHCGGKGKGDLLYWGQGVCECPKCRCGIPVENSTVFGDTRCKR